MHANSNALLVSGAESTSGRPLAVMGPQVGYFMPQILIEEDLHGPDIDAPAPPSPASTCSCCSARPRLRVVGHLRGPGHHRHFAEQLCEPGGGPRPCSRPLPLQGHLPPDGDADRGRTRSRRTRPTSRRRRRSCSPRSAPSHGIVHKRGTVNGKPVAFVKQRSTYFHEADSARGFSDLNGPPRSPTSRTSSTPSPRSASPSTGSTPTTATSATSTPATTRSARRASTPDSRPGAPAQWDWQGFIPPPRRPTTRPSRAPAGHQPELPHLLEQQAGAGLQRGRRQLRLRPDLPLPVLDRRGSSGAIAARKMTLAEPVDAMEDAGTRRPARRAQVLPLHAAGDRHARAIRSSPTPSTTLRGWLIAGAHRRDNDQRRRLRRRARRADHGRLVAARRRAHVRAELGPTVFDQSTAMIGLDNEPNNHGATSAAPTRTAGTATSARTCAGCSASRSSSRCHVSTAATATSGAAGCCSPRRCSTRSTSPRSSSTPTAAAPRATSPASISSASAPSAASRCRRSPGSTGRRSSKP